MSDRLDAKVNLESFPTSAGEAQICPACHDATLPGERCSSCGINFAHFAALYSSLTPGQLAGFQRKRKNLDLRTPEAVDGMCVLGSSAALAERGVTIVHDVDMKDELVADPADSVRLPASHGHEAQPDASRHFGTRADLPDWHCGSAGCAPTHSAEYPCTASPAWKASHDVRFPRNVYFDGTPVEIDTVDYREPSGVPGQVVVQEFAGPGRRWNGTELEEVPSETLVSNVFGAVTVKTPGVLRAPPGHVLLLDGENVGSAVFVPKGKKVVIADEETSRRTEEARSGCLDMSMIAIVAAMLVIVLGYLLS